MLLITHLLSITAADAQQAQEPIDTTIEKVLVVGKSTRRVRVRGSVHDIALKNNHVVLQLDDGLSSLMVSFPTQREALPLDYLDAVVEVTGVALPNSEQPPVLFRLWSKMALDSINDLRVIKPGRADVYAGPMTPLADVRQTLPLPLAQRVSVTGTVTYASKVGWFYIQDKTGVVRGRRPDFIATPHDQHRPILADTNLKPGDVIEMAGQIVPTHNGKTMPHLIQCEWRVLRNEGPPEYPIVAVSDIFEGDFEGRPVTVTGRVSAVSMGVDPNGLNNHFFGLGDYYALVQLPELVEIPYGAGQYVRLHGVVQHTLIAEGALKEFRVNVNSFDHVESIPFAINRVFLQRWLLGALVVTVVAGVWIFLLRRQVRAQTAEVLAANTGLLRFKAVADTTTDLVAMSTLDGHPIYMNPAGRKLLGIGQEEDIFDVSFESIYTPESMQLFQREGFKISMETGSWEAEVAMRHRNGSIIPVDFVGLVIKSPDGTPLHMACTARDISSRVRVEQQLRASLEQERELNQLKSCFVNTISHEFRTPLGIILFASSMMRRFNDRFGPEERVGQLDAIDKAVEQMNELVEQSLSLGRAEVAAPKKTSFDLRRFSLRLIDEVMSATSYRSPISLKSDEALPASYCDETMLRTILVNLLGNAVKYSPAGSPITLSIQPSGETRALFVVRDHGHGLSDEDLPKLFTTFHRGKGTEGIPGTGLGLAIVKRCTEALGGSVTARNAEDGGAEFMVEIPLFTVAP